MKRAATLKLTDKWIFGEAQRASPSFKGIREMTNTQRLRCGDRIAKSALVASTSATFISATVSTLPLLLTDALVRNYAWSEATLFAGVSAGMILSAIAAPVGVLLIGYWGLRRTIFGVLLVLLAALVLSAISTTPNQLALIWAVSGAASGCLSPLVIGSVVAASRYPSHCGAASGLFFSCAMAGPLFALPLLSLLLEKWGHMAVLWSAAFLVMAATLCAWLCIPANYPHDADRPHSQPRLALLFEPGKLKDLLLLLFLTLVCGITSTGLVGTHLISICRVAGLDLSVSASATAVMGLTALFGGLIFGVTADRYDGMQLLAGYYAFRAVLLFWLPQSSFNFEELSQFAILYGLDWAATMPALARIALDRFGALQTGAIMSLVTVVHHAAAGAASFLVAFAGSQHFSAAFNLGGILCLLAALLLIAHRANSHCAP